MINRQPAKEGVVTDTNFPLKVVCPECNSAINRPCKYNSKPLDMNGFIAIHNETIYVDWFHFSRVELAKCMADHHCMNEKGIFIPVGDEYDAALRRVRDRYPHIEPKSFYIHPDGTIRQCVPGLPEEVIERV